MSGPWVYGRGWLIGPDGRGVRLSGAGCIEDVAEACRRAKAAGVRTLFVTDALLDEWRQVDPDSDVTVVCVPADVGRLSGPWAGLSPRDLGLTFGRLAGLLGVEWRSSVGSTAESLILATHPRGRGGAMLDQTPVIPVPARGSTVELPWSGWRRELTGDERRSSVLHVFDANAQYLAAWGAVDLGRGEPQLRRRPPFHGEPGLWRIPGLADCVVPFQPLLPAPWLPDREWFATATVARAWEVLDGIQLPEIAEAWQWPAKSRYLRGAAERLREARMGARRTVALSRAELAGELDSEAALARVDTIVVGEAVEQAVKDIYRVQTGRFGWEGRERTSGFYRPDWGHAVRATARVNLHRRISGLTRAPFAIATDSLCFLDDEPDPRVFAERIRLPISTEGSLGHYRPVVSVEIGDHLRELVQTATPATLIRAAQLREVPA